MTDLILYHSYAFQLLEQFEDSAICQVPRSENKQVNALANLVLALPKEGATTIHVYRRWVLPLLAYIWDGRQHSNVVSIFEIKIKD